MSHRGLAHRRGVSVVGSTKVLRRRKPAPGCDHQIAKARAVAADASDGHIRLSVGVERLDDILADLEPALRP